MLRLVSHVVLSTKGFCYEQRCNGASQDFERPRGASNFVRLRNGGYPPAGRATRSASSNEIRGAGTSSGVGKGFAQAERVRLDRDDRACEWFPRLAAQCSRRPAVA